MIVRFLVVQALTIGLLGGIVGAGATKPTELGVATAIGAALVAPLVASVGPAVLALRAVPAAILRGE